MAGARAPLGNLSADDSTSGFRGISGFRDGDFVTVPKLLIDRRVSHASGETYGGYVAPISTESSDERLQASSLDGLKFRL